MIEGKFFTFNKVYQITVFNSWKGTLFVTETEIIFYYDLAVISKDPKAWCTTNDIDFFTFKLKPHQSLSKRWNLVNLLYGFKWRFLISKKVMELYFSTCDSICFDFQTDKDLQEFVNALKKYTKDFKYTLDPKNDA